MKLSLAAFFVLLIFALPFGATTADPIDCSVRGNGLPGESGAVHTVTCPLNCTAGPVWGTLIYTDDSAVCTAALHAGHLKAGHTTVAVTIRGPLSRYVGSTRNNIASREYGAWTRSFSVGPPRAAPSRGIGRSNWIQAAKYWGILVVMGIVFLLWMRARRRKFARLAGVFSELAGASGMTYERPDRAQAGLASGEYKGYQVELRTYTHTSSGNPSVTNIEIKTICRETLPEGLRIFPRTALGVIGAAADRLGGEKEIMSGNRDFDQAVYVGASDESVRSLLTAGAQAAILDFFQGRSDWTLLISGNEIKATRSLKDQTRTELESILDAQNRIAAAFAF